MPAYNAAFPAGMSVMVRDLAELKAFKESWLYHHPLIEEQLSYAGVTAMVERIGYYHGGEVLYWLIGAPGVWHECCLRSAALAADMPDATLVPLERQTIPPAARAFDHETE